ncbi:MAG: glycosyltransferase family 2 protein [Flavobacteriales bacterium]|nr:glycosyltransferase family 2 protein [Flavobacteriales bacterium]
MNDQLNLTIVIPLYNEDESLPKLLEWIARVMAATELTYEVILVDDGSNDDSWGVISAGSAADKHVKGIRFTRNYGKSAALNVGFEASLGEVVITMDADMQDSPDEIVPLYQMIKDGNDIVSGWKQKRYDPLMKTIPSKFFNGVTRMMSGIKIHDFNCGLKAYNADVVKSIEIYGEMHRYIPVIAKKAGFGKITEKVVEHREREFGTTKFGLERFIFGFLDLLSVMFITRFSKKPMHLFGSLGTLFFLGGGGGAFYIIAVKLIAQMNHEVARQATEQPLFYLAICSIIIGVQLFLAGFLAELISRSSSDRNKYLIKSKIGIE